MYLEISEKLLGKKSVIDYISDSISKKFPESEEDVAQIRTAATEQDIQTVFNDYYEGWMFDNVKFGYGDIDLILTFMDADKLNRKKAMEDKQYRDDMAAKGIKIIKQKKYRSNIINTIL